MYCIATYSIIYVGRPRPRELEEDLSPVENIFFKRFFFLFNILSILFCSINDLISRRKYSGSMQKENPRDCAGSLVTVRWRLITIRASRWLISETMNVRNVARWTPWHDFNLIPECTPRSREIIMIMRVHARTRGEWLDQWETRKLETLKDVSSRVKSQV